MLKFVMKTMNLGLRFGAVAALLLISQQSMAAGTAAGSTIANQARVDYDVGTIAQEFILSAPAGNSIPGAGQGSTTDFTVDNRVDFTLVEEGVAGPTSVTPNQLNNSVAFRLVNTGNQTQDYQLAPTNLVGGAVNGLTDDAQMNNLRAFVDNGDGVFVAADDTGTFVNSLVADGQVVIFIVADADTVPVLVNGDVANVNLEAITADAGSGGATVTLASGGDTVGEDVVLAVGGANGTGNNNAQDGFQVVTADLQITKVSSLLADPFNPLPGDAFHIPGATVQYVITVLNNSTTTPAVNVSMQDVLLDVEVANGATIAINHSVSGASSCVADIGDANGDGCALVADPDANPATNDQQLVVNPSIATGLDSIGIGENVTITFDTTIL